MAPGFLAMHVWALFFFGLVEVILGTPLPLSIREVGFAVPFNKQLLPISKRSTLPVTMTNLQWFYTIDVKFGSNSQLVTLHVATGSSDTWAFNPTSCKTVNCQGGSFHGVESSSLKIVRAKGFIIDYLDGSGVTGDFVRDNLVIGGKLVTAVQFGLAHAAHGFGGGILPYGIFGLGFDTQESLTGNEVQYPNLIDTLVSDGIISSRVFSFWMDDLQATSGTLLFGGHDDTKHTGNLLYVPINPSAAGTYVDFTIDWTTLSITDNTGKTTMLTAAGHRAPTLLETGTSLIHIPTTLYTPLATFFSVTSDGIIACGEGTEDGSVNFGFPGGIKISIPFSELALDNGDGRCRFAFVADDSITIFGDPFLRSTYVEFDMDLRRIGIAPTIFSS